jgi:hypothetical protein
MRRPQAYIKKHRGPDGRLPYAANKGARFGVR